MTALLDIITRQRQRLLVASIFVLLLVTLPGNGVFGQLNATVSAPGNEFSSANWASSPIIERTVIQKSYGGETGELGCGLGGCGVSPDRAFFIYAQATPGSGVMTSVIANIGGANASLASGAWTVNGQGYNYRTSFTTRSPAQLPSGTQNYTVTATNSLPAATTDGPNGFIVDTSQPQPIEVFLDGATGAVRGQPDNGDRIVYVFDSPIDASSAFGDWTAAAPPQMYSEQWDGSSQSVTIRFTSPWSYGGSSTDPVRITVSNGNSAGQNFGQARVYSNDWTIRCQAVFNGAAAMSAGDGEVVVTLGSQLTGGQIVTPAPVVPVAEVC